MRVLLVGAAAQEGSVDLVAELARDTDLVVGVDAGADICRSAGVGVDLVVGDLDSLSVEGRDALLADGVPIEIHPAEKDRTDLELAVAAALQRGACTLTVTAAFSGRLDHTLAALGAVTSLAVPVDIVEPGFSASVLSSSARSRLRLDTVGETISIIAIEGAANVSCSGVKWPLSETSLSPLSGFGVSNLVTEPSATVVVHRGAVLVVRTLA